MVNNIDIIKCFGQGKSIQTITKEIYTQEKAANSMRKKENRINITEKEVQNRVETVIYQASIQPRV
jgi:hypothetical protein